MRFRDRGARAPHHATTAPRHAHPRAQLAEYARIPPLIVLIRSHGAMHALPLLGVAWRGAPTRGVTWRGEARRVAYLGVARAAAAKARVATEAAARTSDGGE